MISNTKMNLGQLLLRQGVLDEDQLAHAMSEHKRTGIMLSKILVRLGMVSEDTLTSILGVQMQSATKMRIGEMLLAQGYINEDQLNKALETQKTTGKRLGRTLVDLGFMPEERLIEILSRQFEVPYVKLETFHIDPEAYNYLPEDLCKQYKVVPLFVQQTEDERHQSRQVMTIAMTDPTNMRTITAVRFKVKMEVDVVMASDEDVKKAIERIFAGHGGVSEESLADLIGDSKDGEELETVERGQGNQEEELSDEEGRQVVKIVTTLIHEAIARKASDIHLEPQETYLKLRYRIDGDLQVMSPIPARLMPQILSRIKLLSKMDIAEKRKPLDGRFTVRYKGSEVDLRVSSFPISLRKRGVCEKIVMRILNPNSGQFPLKDMGFDPRVLKQFIDAINAPNGIVLVTGPTGSGKSTTLYASIGEILDSTINISTMEDPVELNIDGVNQGQINNAAGFTFAAGIRALLRQDPDVIMIGEMRDQETSSMAIEAALTGHLVFSTLHTNDAAGAFPRLLEMGLEPFLVSTAIKGVLAQRLVRRICKFCKEPYEISEEMRNELHLTPDMQFFHGRGCEKCDGSGYKGRAGIYEFLVPNESVRNLIIKRSSGDVIKRAAMQECDMITLRMDGISKALQGITTLEQAVGASAADD
ncbi:MULTISPECIES: GspE/PulE family protein [unclassified Fibrobacter]|uniref:GspE/PulE family protein n=1 Tax=unclassified Fibrobacter TaxID=2634177 RepID=UPI000D7A871B|nr:MULTISPECIES: ATPase, T2SS/T4P/T4SS family [unclassified Fibrobacter]PWJ60697.1 type IV pilus assembly protein PilB [Fibrobacter sp. UWR4]PZW63901.1 type IV pilus assembly protein PilB [Fibrobacter sp. UWR1]